MLLVSFTHLQNNQSYKQLKELISLVSRHIWYIIICCFLIPATTPPPKKKTKLETLNLEVYLVFLISSPFLPLARRKHLIPEKVMEKRKKISYEPRQLHSHPPLSSHIQKLLFKNFTKFHTEHLTIITDLYKEVK